jgi:hypothetical protein
MNIITAARINATPRDKYWAAVYLRMLVDTAKDNNVESASIAILEAVAKDACDDYCEAQVEADDLKRAFDEQ